MQQPTRLISTPFAQGGEKTEIQNVTGEFDNSATYQLGFPPLTMQSISSGGKPPKGTDFNGVLFDITENISFLCKGGRYQYNAGLSTLIGGYPEGSNLLLDDNVTEVVSTVAENQNNPNTNMAGWILKPNKTTAVNVADASGETQQQVNYNGGSKWHSRVGGYLKNERVVLTNGDIVKSTVGGNTNDPNSDMTGWDFNDNCVGSIEKLRLRNPKKGERVYLISVNEGQMEGGGNFVATQKSGLVDDGGIIISTNAPNIFYVRINFDEVSPEMFGAKINEKTFDSATALQSSFISGYPVSCRGGSYYSSKPLFHRSGFKLKGGGFWNKTRILKTTSDVGDLPSILSPNGIDSISYQKDAVLIAIPDSGDYCHDVEIKDVLTGREWDELNPLFLTGYSYYAPYIAQSKFDSVWFNATRYTWYSVNQWMCTFNRCEGAGGEWVVGGLDGDLVRGGTTSTYNSCWSKVVHIAGANAWSFTNMTTVTMNSCGTDGLGLSSSVGGAVVKAKNSGITFNGFGIEVTRSENLFNFENCAVNIKALHFHEMFNNYGRLFIINGGVVNISCSILEMVNKDTAVNIPDFALVSNGGSFKIDNVISDPPIFGLTNAPQSKNAVIIAADSHGLIDANGSRQEWSEGSGINKTNRAIQINNHSDNIGVVDPTAIHYATNSFQLGNARLFRDSSGLLRQTRNNDPTDQYDGVPVGGIPIYPDNRSAKNIEGNVYFNSTTSMLMIYNGVAWRAISSVGS